MIALEAQQMRRRVETPRLQHKPRMPPGQGLIRRQCQRAFLSWGMQTLICSKASISMVRLLTYADAIVPISFQNKRHT